MATLRVLLADSQAFFRAGVRSLLEEITGVEVVAEASSGPEALTLVKEHVPDLLITAIAITGFDGLELTAQVVKEFPQTKVVILSAHPEYEYVREALHVGATGYLLKDSTTAELDMAVRAIKDGQVYLSPAISKQLAKHYLGQGSDVPPAGDPLTPRQRDVLRLIAEGGSTKSISERLRISVKTVEAHRYQLMHRLGIHEIAGLVRYAIRMGLADSKH
jgi:DNA-binding NarL/FixJ family response regulator